MPTSIREQALAAFKSQLDAVTGMASITRDDYGQTAPGSLPALIMVDGGQSRTIALGNDSGQSGAAGSDRDGEVFGQETYTARVAVYGYVDAADSTALGAAISDLYAKVVQAVLADPYLDGSAQYLREAADSLSDPEINLEGVLPTAVFAIHFEIEFVTKSGDPFSAA
jgi:hypothetical protein